MFFFSGTVFPIDGLPRALRPFVELLPLTYAIHRLRRRVVVQGTSDNREERD
jgi:ABC-type polysaccharide/polyol phosphate export permease